jgi:hypothetical protein
MKWYYFYTPNYHFYRDKINQRLYNSKFQANGIEIPKLNLSSLKNFTHHFTNLTIKIELILKCIEENMGEVIVFTDATIYIGEKVDEMYDYFIQKMSHNEDLILASDYDNSFNIGFLVLRCNERSLNFWKFCLDYMNQNISEGKNIHDQGLVNDILFRNSVPYDLGTLKIATFEKERIWVSNELPEELRHSFYVFKITVMMDVVAESLKDPNKTYSSHRQRLNALYFARFIDDDEYMYHSNDELYWE